MCQEAHLCAFVLCVCVVCVCCAYYIHDTQTKAFKNLRNFRVPLLTMGFIDIICFWSHVIS
jgi:hypothetical protein